MKTTEHGSTYVIAELGACHDGYLHKMLQGVEVAAECGASALKLQFTTDAKQMSDRRGFATIDGYEKIYDRYLAWDMDWHERVAEACKDAGIDYMCTVYLSQDVKCISAFVKRFKISSFESMDEKFVSMHVGYDKPIHVSLGMRTQTELDMFNARVEKCCRVNGPADIRAMHCVSSYPAPYEALNLSLLKTEQWDGWSDHSDPCLTMTGALAVAAGAKTIEAHLKLDTTSKNNPDEPHAMDAAQFKEYVSHVSFAELCLGSGIKDLQDCEQSMRQYVVPSQ